jgi:hypothetical protein
MRKTLTVLFFLFTASAGWSGDYFTLGGIWGYGSNVTSGVDVQTQDLKTMEGFISIPLEEETFLALRIGRIQPRSEEQSEIDLDYLSMTVTYQFNMPLGTTGFFAGPSYYSGDITHYNPSLSEGELAWNEEVDKFGATGGVEAFFPLSRTFYVYAQIGAHYIPAAEEQFVVGLGVGMAVRF